MLTRSTSRWKRTFWLCVATVAVLTGLPAGSRAEDPAAAEKRIAAHIAAGEFGPASVLAQVLPGDQLILITQEGMIIRTAVDGIREIGRSTQGVRLINLEGDDRLVAIAKVLERDDDPEGLAELPPEEDEPQGTIE